MNKFCQPVSLVLLIVFTICSGCSKPNAGPAGPGGGGSVSRAALVYVGEVIEKEVMPTTYVVGTIIARRTSVVASGADGKVNQLLVREGDVVEAGKELSVLNTVTTNLGIEEAERVLQEREQMVLEMRNGSRPEEIIKAEAQMEVARVTREIAMKKWDRLNRLGERNAINQDELDEARERALGAQRLFDSAEANYKLVKDGPRAEEIAQAEARYQAQVKQVAYLNAEKDKRTTRAPFKGVIVEEHTEDGEWLSKGAPVVTIANLEEVQVIANVDQLEIDNVILGTQVEVMIESVTQSLWTGVVEAIIPRSDWKSGSRTFPVKVTIKNQFQKIGERLRPVLTEGMYARVKFQGRPRKSLLVPKNAIIRSESGSRVVAVIPGETPNTGKAKPVVITEGAAFEEFIEVKTGDLPAGTQVVTEGAERLSPFAEIIITTPDVSGQPDSDSDSALAPENTDSETKESGSDGKEADA